MLNAESRESAGGGYGRPSFLCIRDWMFGVGRFLPPSARLALAPSTLHNSPQMSGMFFVNPGVRFSRRDRVCQSRVQSVLFRWLTGADRRCLRLGSRVYEAEFPLARLIVYRFLLLLGSWSVLGSRATDRASTDALRPFNNWVKPEDQYGISFIGEKWPAFARRLPQKGRQLPAPPKRALARTGEEIAPAANHGPFHRRRKAGGETGAATTAAGAEQWGAAVAAFT